MLVLARKNKEAVVIAASDNSHELVRVTVIDICEGKVKLGFEADRGVPIHREEIWERVRAESRASQLSISMTNNHEGQSV